MKDLLLAFPQGCREGRFLRREKRFFVYAELDGREICAHTNNTGTMLGLLKRGAPVLLAPASNPERKLRWSVLAMGLDAGRGGFWVGVDTSVPNRLLSIMFSGGLLPWTDGYSELRREAVNGESRLDGLITGTGKPDLWVECKNVTLVEDCAAAFPDAVTARGAKHLDTLMRLVSEGHRAAMLYIVQRPDGHCFRAADYVDPVYAERLARAADAGVEIYPVVVDVSPDGIRFGKTLKFEK